MYWQDEASEPTDRRAPDEVVDVAFSLVGRTLPVDHAHALYEALRAALPWLPEEAGLGVHAIHVAASQNGWQRPDDSDGGVLHVSRRTRMTLRLPRSRMPDLQALVGAALDVDGHALTVGEPVERPLVALPTLFARTVACPSDQPEEAFVEAAATELRRLGIRPRKLLCGMEGRVRTPAGRLFTRSLLVADLGHEDSLALQRRGIGPHRELGCGLFVPHKGIAPVPKTAED